MYSRINNDESSVGGLILAAGLSTRMGQSKPLTKFLDKKLIDQTIKTMQEAGIDNIQIVTGFEHGLKLIYRTIIRQTTFIRSGTQITEMEVF